jgi:hypothetical protein
MKYLLFALISILFMLFVSCDFCDRSNIDDMDSGEIQLIWKGDSIGSLFIEKSHILLPVSFNNYDEVFMLELRLDFEGSFLFEEAVNNYMSEIPDFDLVSDDDAGILFIEDISGNIDKYQFEDRTLLVKKYYSTEAGEIIGFLDLSFFRDNIIKINFKEEKIKVFKEKENDELSDLSFDDFEIINGRIYINLNINEIDYKFMLLAESRVYALFNTENINENELTTILNSQKVENPALFYTPHELIEQENTEGIIGSSFLENTCLYLDLENYQYAFVIMK